MHPPCPWLLELGRLEGGLRTESDLGFEGKTVQGTFFELSSIENAPYMWAGGLDGCPRQRAGTVLFGESRELKGV